MLRVVAGPFHPDLEQAFTEHLHALKQDPLAPMAVVAPSRRLLNRLRVVSAESFPCMAAVAFFNLRQWALEIVRGQTDHRPIDDPLYLEQFLIERIRREFTASASLSQALHAPGIAAALAGAIRDLRDAAVDPNTAIEALREDYLRHHSASEFARLRDLFLLAARFDEELEALKRLDTPALIRLAAASVSKSPILDGYREIIYYGAYDLTQQHVDLLEQLARRRPVTFFTPRRSNHPAYAYQDSFFAEVIARMAARIDVLEKPLSEIRPRILSTAGAHEEVRACAKEIVRLHGNEAIPFHEIGVVARTLEPYAASIEEIFPANAIPYASSASFSLAREPLAQTVATLFSLHDFERTRVLAVVNPEHSAPWENLTRRLGIGRGADTWRNRLEPCQEKGYRDRDGFQVSAPLVRKLLEKVNALAKAVENLPEQASWSTHVQSHIRLIRTFLDEAALEPIVSILEGLAHFDEFSPAVERREFVRTFMDALRRRERPLGDSSSLGVQVLDAMSARGIPFTALIVLGLNENVFPRFILEEPFIKDDVRANMVHVLGNRIPIKKDGYAEEKLLFALCREAARKHLILSFQRADEKGRTLTPSIYLSEIADYRRVLRSDPAVVTRVGLRPAEKIRGSAQNLTPSEAFLRQYLAGADARTIFQGSIERLQRAIRLLEWTEHAERLSPADGAIGPIDSWWTRALGKGLSPTALEKFGNCPFTFFAGHILGLAPLEEPEKVDELEPVDVGTFYHEALRRFYDGLRKDPSQRRDAFLEKSCQETFAEMERTRGIRFPLLWQAEQIRLKNALKDFIERDRNALSGYEPTWFEEWAEATVGGLHVRGRIDRIDVRPEGPDVRVVDYKRRAREGSLDRDILRGRRFQLPLYLEMAKRFTQLRFGRNAAHVSAEFRYVEADPEASPIAALSPDFSMDPFLRVLGRWADYIRKGFFFIHEEFGKCPRCEFQRTCRKNLAAVRRRARFDPATQDYWNIVKGRPHD